MERIRVLIADDHRLFRQGLRALLRSLPVTEVVGEAETGREAVAKARDLQPDVILMDIQMPDGNGLEATREILAASPHVGIIMLTMFEDDESVFAAMRSGARGYVLKGADQTDVLRAIEAAASGEALLSPKVAARIATYFATERTVGEGTAFTELTEREREVLGLIARNLTNPEIARSLDISGKTVRNHVSNIFSKLQVADRAEAIVRAHEAGLGRRA
jgi:DNA-binding NarL/FixJ family response regulator